MGNPIVHFEILGTDGPALQRYYAELFGWEIENVAPMNYGLVAREGNTNANGVGIGGGIMGMAAMPHHVTVYAEVEDVAAALARAEELGGKAVHGPETVEAGGVELGHFTDPEGHMIGVLRFLT